MADIVGIDGLTPAQLLDGVRQGGRFVVYEYVISIVVMTFRRPSRIYYIPPGASVARRALPFCATSVVLGWWGVPWGFIWTPTALVRNLSGGRDVTSQVISSLMPPDTRGA